MIARSPEAESFEAESFEAASFEAASFEIGPTCGPEKHCITCGDQGVPMRVLSVDDDALALCRRKSAASSAGVPLEALVDVALVGDVRPGDLVLVHAGIALVRLDETALDETALDERAGAA